MTLIDREKTNGWQQMGNASLNCISGGLTIGSKYDIGRF